VQLLEGGAVGFSATLFDQSHLIMSGGYIGRVVGITDEATFTMTGGVLGNMMSPVVDYFYGIEVLDRGRLNLRGGRLDFPVIGLFHESTLHVYGAHLQLVGGPPTGGYQITGIFEDGQSFSVSISSPRPRTAIVLHNIPEPASIAIGNWLCVLLFIACRRTMRPTRR
jgi:hypothetical protein